MTFLIAFCLAVGASLLDWQLVGTSPLDPGSMVLTVLCTVLGYAAISAWRANR